MLVLLVWILMLVGLMLLLGSHHGMVLLLLLILQSCHIGWRHGALYMVALCLAISEQSQWDRLESDIHAAAVRAVTRPTMKCQWVH